MAAGRSTCSTTGLDKVAKQAKEDAFNSKVSNTTAHAQRWPQLQRDLDNISPQAVPVPSVTEGRLFLSLISSLQQKNFPCSSGCSQGPFLASSQQKSWALLITSKAPAKGDGGRDPPAREEWLYRGISCTSAGNTQSITLKKDEGCFRTPLTWDLSTCYYLLIFKVG